MVPSATEALYGVGVDPSTLTPAELASLADSYHGLDVRIAEVNKLLEGLRSERGKIKTLLLAAMHANGDMVAIGGNDATVSRKTKYVPTVQNWDETRAYIVANGAWELLHKRITESAVRERWDAGETVPGVVSLPVETLSVSTTTQRRKP